MTAIGFREYSADLEDGTSFTANRPVWSFPYQAITADFGYQAKVEFMALMPEDNATFELSNSAEVTVLASNVNDFDNPDLTVTAEVSDRGSFASFVGLDSVYRYWQIRINDNDNLENERSIGYVYLGGAQKFEANNVDQGFEYLIDDTSTFEKSESGFRFYDLKRTERVFANLNATLLTAANANILVNLYDELGKSGKFLCSIDPAAKISEEIGDVTKIVRFDQPPRVRHTFYDKYLGSFVLREAF